jgi:hypothetical protein
MNVTIEPGPVGPHDPKHYAPRRRREEAAPRLAAADEIRAVREKRVETVGRVISPLALMDARLENAVHESLRRPRDAQARVKARAPAGEVRHRSTLFGLAIRPMVAIVIWAAIALFFVIMMPGPRAPDATQLLHSFTTALAPQRQSVDIVPKRPSEEAPKPALAEFHSLLAPGETAQAAERDQPDAESDKVLQQFLQWRRKSSPGGSAQQPLHSEQRQATNR